VKALSGATCTVLGLAGANWVIEQNLLPLVLLSVAVLAVAFLFLTGPLRLREVRAPNLPRSRSLPRSEGSGVHARDRHGLSSPARVSRHR
jgi:hypothetical protein